MLQLQASKPYPIPLLPRHIFGAPEHPIYLQESVFSSPALKFRADSQIYQQESIFFSLKIYRF